MMQEIRQKDENLNFTLISGITELIQKLKKNKYQIALATGSKRETVERVLKTNNILEFFDYVVTGDDVLESKPDPAAFNKVITQFNKETKIYIIEDSPAGIEAAKRTNAFVIGFNIEKSNADVNIKGHKELAKYFQKIN